MYQNEDKSLLEYRSKEIINDEGVPDPVYSYLNLTDDDYNVLNSAEMSITRTYGSKKISTKSTNELLDSLITKLEGFEKHKFFSLSKNNNIQDKKMIPEQ